MKDNFFYNLFIECNYSSEEAIGLVESYNQTLITMLINHGIKNPSDISDVSKYFEKPTTENLNAFFSTVSKKITNIKEFEEEIVQMNKDYIDVAFIKLDKTSKARITQNIVEKDPFILTGILKYI